MVGSGSLWTSILKFSKNNLLLLVFSDLKDEPCPSLIQAEPLECLALIQSLDEAAVWYLLTVIDDLIFPKVDGIACPEIDEYNILVYILEKGKDASHNV